MKRLCLSALLAALAASAFGALPPVTPEERARIEAAVPRDPVVKPAKPRRLLICTMNAGYDGHPSIMHANEALTLMGKRTGAFEAVVSDDPNMFRRDSLKNFDAVFFNNTVGNLFTDPELRRDLLEFVTGGGGVLGVHGASIAFAKWPGAIEDWPEWGHVIGARGATHKSAAEPVTLKLDDPTHPLTRVFGGPFEYADEFFRFFEPYSRDRVRVLLSIDTDKTDFSRDPKAYGNVIRPDNDYPIAWVRNYGRGRVFYSTIAHQPRVFWDAKMLQFLLGAIQFAVGDHEVPTTPSSKLTPAVRAQEKLGWKLGIEAWTFNKYTYFEAIEKTAQLGLPYIGGLNVVTVSKDMPKPFDPSLTDEELAQIRLKLDEHGLRLMTYFIHDIPNDEAFCRRLFEFARKMGIDTILGEPKPEALDLIEKFANEYGINVAIHNHASNLSPQYWQPEGVLKAIQHRSRRIGACPDIGYWMRSGVDPIAGIRLLGDRILAVQMHDLHATGKEGHDVPWGTGVAKTGEILREFHRLGIKPRMIGLEYSYDWLDSMPEIAESIEFYNKTTLQLAKP